MANSKRIGVIGAGPTGLFILKRLVEAHPQGVEIVIFEKSPELGSGMPYSRQGALPEHITNVSASEIPDMVVPMHDWIRATPRENLAQYQIDPEQFSNHTILPRLLFGEYLQTQFELLRKQARDQGIDVIIHHQTQIHDIIDRPASNKTAVQTVNGESILVDRLVICSGHYWPKKIEGRIPGYFDSPYPPKKIDARFNHPIAIKGASLTAIDAVRSLSRRHGKFVYRGLQTIYEPDNDYPNFRLVVYSDNGLLPAVRIHLEDQRTLKGLVLSDEEIQSLRQKNEGFVPLDEVFERLFKDPLAKKDPETFRQIKALSLEDFVARMMTFRESQKPFELLKSEYIEANQSIREKRPIYWKEMLATLSFAMNRPAKYFSAEDMLRLEDSLMPLISVVIAFLPQSSAEELLALAQAGVIEIVHVGKNSRVIPQESGGIVYHCLTPDGKVSDQRYQTFLDCTGQPALGFQEIPFPSLITYQTASAAFLRFRDPRTGLRHQREGNKKIFQDETGNYFLQVPGVAVNDNFQLLNVEGIPNERIFMISVPCIAGFNPDYSGLDFCESASALVVNKLLQ